jgi:hypothetical protein
VAAEEVDQGQDPDQEQRDGDEDDKQHGRLIVGAARGRGIARTG